MKVKRHKRVRKVLTFFKNNFKFQAPYKVIVDGTFCKAALKSKVNIIEQLPKYLENEVKICTTKCCIAECEAFGSLLYGPLKILQQFELIDCKHTYPKPASPCLKNMIGQENLKKYFIGTQDAKLRDNLSKIPGVPSLFLISNTIVLDTPSKFSKDNAEEKIEVQKKPSEYQQSTLEKLKKEAFGEQEVKHPRRKKKIKGPNPLSCKPKKKLKTIGMTGSKQKKARKRTKANLAKAFQNV